MQSGKFYYYYLFLITKFYLQVNYDDYVYGHHQHREQRLGLETRCLKPQPQGKFFLYNLYIIYLIKSTYKQITPGHTLNQGFHADGSPTPHDTGTNTNEERWTRLGKVTTGAREMTMGVANGGWKVV